MHTGFSINLTIIFFFYFVSTNIIIWSLKKYQFAYFSMRPFVYWLWFALRQAKNAWLSNIRAPMDNACQQRQNATAPRSASTSLTNSNALVEGTNSHAEMALVLTLHSDVMVKETALQEKMNWIAVSLLILKWLRLAIDVSSGHVSFSVEAVSCVLQSHIWIKSIIVSHNTSLTFLNLFTNIAAVIRLTKHILKCNTFTFSNYAYFANDLRIV